MKFAVCVLLVAVCGCGIDDGAQDVFTPLAPAAVPVVAAAEAPAVVAPVPVVVQELDRYTQKDVLDTLWINFNEQRVRDAIGVDYARFYELSRHLDDYRVNRDLDAISKDLSTVYNRIKVRVNAMQPQPQFSDTRSGIAAALGEYERSYFGDRWNTLPNDAKEKAHHSRDQLIACIPMVHARIGDPIRVVDLLEMLELMETMKLCHQSIVSIVNPILLRHIASDRTEF